MKTYEVFLFDLDGTLIDSSEGIFRSFQYALEKYGMEIGDGKNRLIGPPLIYSFRNFFGFDEEKAKEAVSFYRERYEKKGLYENRLYDGVEEVLKNLKSAGKTILVTTSKPEAFARVILEDLGVAKYFDYIAGAAFEGYPETKADVIEYGLKSLGISKEAEILMVGDRYYDVVGAHTLGLDCLGILYGFGDREEFEEAGADYIESDAMDILKYM